MSWRSIVKHYIEPNGDIYEFGVFTGGSIEFLIKDLDSVAIPIRKIFGFDSFEGIPEEKLDKLNRDEWKVGFCSAAKTLNCTKEKAIRYVEERLSPLHSNICLIPGFWDAVLVDELVSRYNMKPASYIDIDGDIYSSAILSLDFMFRNKLVIPGTLIGYDDWGGTMTEHKEFEAGESKAHKEMMEKYNVVAKQLYKVGQPPHIQTLFRVKSIG
jgi:hypothetical protein